MIVVLCIDPPDKGSISTMKSRYSLGIDIGTTKVAVAIVDTETRQALATAAVAHESDVPGLPIGRSEQVVSKILSTLDESINRLPLHRRHTVASIGVTGQMHGVVLCNTSTSEVSHLVTWQDQRCCEGDFLPRLHDKIADRTPQTGYGTSTLAWLAAHEPRSLECYSGTGTVHDYLVCIMSGNERPFIDPSDAASFGLFDISTRQWREESISKAGIPRSLLPEVRQAGARVGSLVGEYANRWGVPAGTPIGNALGDNQASLYGSLTDPKNQIALTMGTGAQLSVLVPHLPKDPLPEHAHFEYRPYVDDSYIAAAVSLSGGRALACLGKALEGFMRELGVQPLPSLEAIQNAMHRQGFEKLTTDLCAKSSLSGERYAPLERGSFTNLSFDNFTIGDMTVALCRGLVASLRDSLPSDLLESKREVVGSGNAIFKSPVMQQVIRESFGCSLILEKSPEATARGAALLAAQSL
jgi:sedoheptulokinase